jgi:hypothetical protein
MEEGKDEFDFADLPVPTAVIPTGQSFYIEEELSGVRPKVETKAPAGLRRAEAAGKMRKREEGSPSA